MNQDSPVQLPTYPGTNFAPLKPLLQLRDKEKKPQHYLQEAIKERYDHYYKADQQVWNEMFSVAQLISLFIEGKQLLSRSPSTGAYVPIKPKREDASTRRAMNLMQFYETNCVVKYILSNPDVTITAGDDSDRSIAAARAADVVNSHYERRFYSRYFDQREARLLLRFGTHINMIRQDDSVEGVTALREIVEDREVPVGHGYGYCGACDNWGKGTDFMRPAEFEGQGADEQVAAAAVAEGAADEPPRQQVIHVCPKCGSRDVNVQPPPVGRVQTVTGVERVNLGDLVCRQLPMAGCRWDLHARPEDSSWFIYNERTQLSAIRRLLGQIRVPGSAEGDTGLDIIDALAYAGQAVGGSSAGGDKKKTGAWREPVTVTQFWMSPDDYGDIPLKGDEQTVSGETLPAGAYMGELFPRGCVAVGLNGLAALTGLYGERHRDYLTSSVWHMRPLSGAGRPMSDTVEVQKRFNTLDSQQLAQMGSTSTPAMLYDKRGLPDGTPQYLGTPKINIPVLMHLLPAGSKLTDIVAPAFQAQSVPGQFVQYVQQFLRDCFEVTSHVTNFSNGLNVDPKTATGANIADANSQSISGPMLQLKAEMRLRGAEITVEQFRRHNPVKRFFRLSGKYGRKAGVLLTGEDLDAALVFEVTEDSEAPQNVFTKRQTRAQFYSLFGGFAQYVAFKKQYPREVADLERLWNIQTEGEDYDEVAGLCRRRLDQMRQAAQSGVLDPATIVTAIRPPVSAYEPKQDVKLAWWQDWLDTDEGCDAPMPLRLAAEMMVMVHHQLQGAQAGAVAAQTGEAQAAQNLPGMMAQRALQPAPEEAVAQ